MSQIIILRRNNHSQYRGKEIFEIHPVILGGNPFDPANKTVLSRAQHIEAVTYWNNQIRINKRAVRTTDSPNDKSIR